LLKSLNPIPPTATKWYMDTQRLWLMYPSRNITKPIIFELSKKFEVEFNIRQASVNDEIGLVSLEEQGIKVEPVEIQTIEG
jgi:L-aspartate semialdehyde sulfurtransferase ferredoxin